METKGGYKMQEKGYSHNMADYSPNAGENQELYDSSASRSSTTGIADMAGVEYGLSMVKGTEVKNAEMVTDNQRPEGRRESAGDGFVIGC
jgi:hypothetical protein